ncbi:MAG TPA: hypothetical protein VFH21_01450 [Burkholderiales bacterium]|jgi:hypothetical protein|nr:hypothetical protein [Burkholderiales bacterium]
MAELKIFYVLPAGTWEVKTARTNEPIAAFRSQEEARNYIQSVDRIARRNNPDDSDPGKENLW